ncbi:polysaccharide pyruvyl transferase family protein [Gordonia rubripertincta]|uniref:polysaccharide pyruvyl transferase family protein n=1 Tax=Gordonia rubripertincta TaxID=36822 RepID=UPI00117F9BDD|nr:polysaccharide pyruvyl transferase family protein [Gordonia rubripertincta]TSD96226.1 polysaccharide pyruvyl transferase family protein [Gordonia rubripertincta]
MSRVGVLTRHCYPNYGSLLQAIALQEALVQSGVDVRVVDYVPPSDSRFGLATASLRESRMRDSVVRSTAYLAIQGPNYAVMASRFRGFQKKNLRLTRKITDGADVEAIADDFDRIVVGSDQVWNCIHGAIDEAYFLRPVLDVHKKYSYAASFGSGVTTDSADTRRLLGDFQAVSVREPSAVPTLNEYGVSVRRDVDPVLLHGRDFWAEFAAEVERPDKPYFLAYQLHNTPDFNRRAEELAQRMGLPLRRVNVDIKRLVGTRGRPHYLVTPENFVALFRDAEAVITDSFHGLSFSLMFGRPVYPVLPEKGSARLTDLLRSVGLERLAIADGDDLPASADYDAGEVRDRLSALAGSSWEYVQGLAS